jgi:hypothetical protein
MSIAHASLTPKKLPINLRNQSLKCVREEIIILRNPVQLLQLYPELRSPDPYPRQTAKWLGSKLKA